MHNPSYVEMEIADASAALENHPNRLEIENRFEWQIKKERWLRRTISDSEISRIAQQIILEAK